MKLKNTAIAAALVVALPMAVVTPAGAAENNNNGLMSKLTSSSGEKKEVSKEDKAYNEFAAAVKAANDKCKAEAGFKLEVNKDNSALNVIFENEASVSGDCMTAKAAVVGAFAKLIADLATEKKTINEDKLKVALEGKDQQAAQSGPLDAIKKAVTSSDSKDGKGEGSSAKLTSSSKSKKDGDKKEDGKKDEGDNNDTLKTVGIVIGVIAALAAIAYAVTNFLPKPAAPAPAPAPAPEAAPAPAVQAPVKGIAK